MKYVNYEVKGYPDKFQVGPYTEEEVEIELSDVRGYEGIYNCYITDLLDDLRRHPGEEK